MYIYIQKLLRVTNLSKYDLWNSYERRQNTHGQGERVKYPFYPANVNKRALRPHEGHVRYCTQYYLFLLLDLYCSVFYIIYFHLGLTKASWLYPQTEAFTSMNFCPIQIFNKIISTSGENFQKILFLFLYKIAKKHKYFFCFVQ